MASRNDFKFEETLNINHREAKICIWDFDSVCHQALYSGKDSSGNKLPEYEKKDLDFIFSKINEIYFKTLSEIEEYFDIVRVYIVIKGEGNFRKKLYPDYKKNRIPPNPLINKVYDYVKVAYQAVWEDNYEADDLVFTISEKINHSGIIIAIDKDMAQIPSIFYNWNTKKFKKVSPQESKYNLAIQMITGDPSDGINFTRGWGIKKAKKLINPNMTDYQYIKNILWVYQKLYKHEAKKIIRLAYTLLKLHKIPK